MFCLWCVEPKTSPKEDILDQSEPMTKSAMESSNQPSKNVRLRYQLLHYSQNVAFGDYARPEVTEVNNLEVTE